MTQLGPSIEHAWDEGLHPRDQHGRFADVLKNLPIGGRVHAPGVKHVRVRHLNGKRQYAIIGEDGKEKRVGDAETAARVAMENSVRSGHHGSLGGSTKYDNLEHYSREKGQEVKPPKPGPPRPKETERVAPRPKPKKRQPGTLRTHQEYEKIAQDYANRSGFQAMSTVIANHVLRDIGLKQGHDFAVKSVTTRDGDRLSRISIRTTSAADVVEAHRAELEQLGFRIIGRNSFREFSYIHFAKATDRHEFEKKAVEQMTPREKLRHDLQKLGDDPTGHTDVKRLLDLGSQIRREIETENPRLSELRHRMKIDWVRDRYAYFEAKEEYRRAYRDTALSVLKSVRPDFGTGVLQIGGTGGPGPREVRRAAELFPREWVDASNSDRIPVRPVSSPKRGFYAHWGTNDGDYAGTMMYNDESVAAHELAHRMERILEDPLLQAQAAFWRHRCVGQPTKPLSELRPGHGYRPDETTVEDKWADPYVGKTYGGGGFGTGPTAYEILSMGMEGAFHDRYDMRNKDLSHISWTLAILASLRP